MEWDDACVGQCGSGTVAGPAVMRDNLVATRANTPLPLPPFKPAREFTGMGSEASNADAGAQLRISIPHCAQWLKHYTTCVTLLLSRYTVSHFSRYVFAVSHENRAISLKVSPKRPCRTPTLHCTDHKIGSRYRGCYSYNAARRATLRH